MILVGHRSMTSAAVSTSVSLIVCHSSYMDCSSSMDCCSSNTAYLFLTSKLYISLSSTFFLSSSMSNLGSRLDFVIFFQFQPYLCNNWIMITVAICSRVCLTGDQRISKSLSHQDLVNLILCIVVGAFPRP